MDCCGVNSSEPATARASSNDATHTLSLLRLGASDKTPASAGWKRGSALFLAALVALLPKCPACWSVYAGLSSLLGVSIALDARYLEPLTLAALGVASFGVALRLSRSGPLPLMLALASSLGIWLGKFVLHADMLAYGCSGGLVLAALAARRTRGRPAASSAQPELAALAPR